MNVRMNLTEPIDNKSWILSTKGNVSIAEGTVISSITEKDEIGERGWSYKVKEGDKRIKLLSKRKHLDDIEMDVTTKKTLSTTHRYEQQIVGGVMQAPEDSRIFLSNLTFVNDINDNPSIIFSDDYKLLSVPYPKYYIHVKSRARTISNVSENEQIALDTLREMITEKEFRQYLKYGFISVQGNSKNIYQIFRNEHHIKVWKNGKLIEEICICLTDFKIPLTDKIIAFKIMIESDEKEFHKFGNVYPMYKVA